MTSRPNLGIRVDILRSLKWDIVQDINDISIATGTPEQTIFKPFLSHHIANESLFDPPRNRIDTIFIRDFAALRDMQIHSPEEDRYKLPPSLKIENEDGKPITFRQFVTAFHAYAQRNLDELRRVKGLTYGELITHEDCSQERSTTYGRPVELPQNTLILVKSVLAFKMDDGETRLRVMLLAKGEFSYTTSYHLQSL